MKFLMLFLGLLGVNPVCSGQETLLRQQVVGNWQIKIGSQFLVAPTLGADGSFQTRWWKPACGSQTNETVYHGHWLMTNRVLISTVTNITGVFIVYTNASGRVFTNTESIGHVSHYKILEAGEKRLTLLNDDGSVTSLRRIP